MNKFNLTLIISLSALLLLGIFSSCHDDGPEQRQAEYYDFVEFSTAPDVRPAMFTLYDQATNSPQLLQATNASLTLPDSLRQGQMLFISYTIEDKNLNNLNNLNNPPSPDPLPVKLTGMAAITNSALKKAQAKDLDGWDADPVWLVSLWRAGDHICMRLLLPYDTEPRQFSLVVDEATLSEAEPQAYLYHQRADITRPSFDRQYYAAFSIASLTALNKKPSSEHPHYDALIVHVANTNLTALTTFRIPL